MRRRSHANSWRKLARSRVPFRLLVTGDASPRPHHLIALMCHTLRLPASLVSRTYSLLDHLPIPREGSASFPLMPFQFQRSRNVSSRVVARILPNCIVLLQQSAGCTPPRRCDIAGTIRLRSHVLQSYFLARRRLPVTSLLLDPSARALRRYAILREVLQGCFEASGSRQHAFARVFAHPPGPVAMSRLESRSHRTC